MSNRTAGVIAFALTVSQLACGCGFNPNYAKEETVWKSNMSNANADIQHGKLPQAEEKLNEAMPDAERLDQTKPMHVALTSELLGEVYVREGKTTEAKGAFDRADKSFDEASQRDPELYAQSGKLKHALSLGNLAKLLRDEGQTAQADELMKKAYSLVPMPADSNSGATKNHG